MDPSTKLIGMSKEHREKLKKKERNIIQLSLSYLVLLNVFREDNTNNLSDKLGNLYQSNSLLNKLFLQNMPYHLRMDDVKSIMEHLSSFNTLVIQLAFIDIKMEEKDKCITLLCSFLDSWVFFL